MPNRQQDHAMNRSIGLRLGVSVESECEPEPARATSTSTPRDLRFDLSARRRPLPALDSRHAEAIERHTLSTLELAFTKPLKRGAPTHFD